MQQVVLILIINVIAIAFPSRLMGQYVEEKKLLSYEMKIFDETSDMAKNNILMNKFHYQLLNGDSIRHIENTIQRVNLNLISDSLTRCNFLWNTALFFILARKELRAMKYLTGYLKTTKDTSSIPSLFIQYLCYLPYDSEKADSICLKMTASGVQAEGLLCLQDLISLPNKGNINLYLVPSLIVPGSGLFLLGRPDKGIVSLALNGASAFLIFYLIQENLIINGILMGTALIMKFYPGQLILTSRIFELRRLKKISKRASECTTQLSEQFSLLSFRFT